MSGLLTDAERARFSSYCATEAKSQREMADLLAQFGDAHKAMIERRKSLAVAYMLVAADLRDAETVAVSR